MMVMSTTVHEDVESDGGSNDDDINDENTDNEKVFKFILRKIEKSTPKDNIHLVTYLLISSATQHFQPSVFLLLHRCLNPHCHLSLRFFATARSPRSTVEFIYT